MDEEKRHGVPPQEAKAHGKSGGASGGKTGGKSDFWLTLIGIGKLIKMAILVGLGVAALLAVNHQPPEMLTQAADFVGIDQGSQHLHRLVAKASGWTPRKLEAVGLGCFVYAALFATEGIGLLKKKRWAEYFTIVITISFIPLEVYEIVHHASVAKVVALVLNIVVASYLIVRVRRDRAPERDPQPASAPLGIASR
jgi:uncharacterized membrane protein (DUF2068 family)